MRSVAKLRILLACAAAAFLAGGTAMAKNDGTGNLSKARRERLIAEVAEIKAFLEKNALADTNAVRLLRFAAELEKEVRGRKYGLVFEEHRERVDVELMENVPVLTEVKGRFIAAKAGNVANDAANSQSENGNIGTGNNGNNGNIQQDSPPVNFLIEGDNLAALKLLEKTHRGKIDLVYIDPPYNTGNKDFIYNDSYVDKTDTFRHSKWLSFMQKRLEIAKRLMSDKGVIFISIDDNEQAALKLLCDDVFGDRNFIGQLTWESTTQPINAGKARFQLQQKTEYIICYAKSRDKKDTFLLRKQDTTLKYPHQGKFGACRFEVIEKSDAGVYQRDSMKFQILGQYPRKGKRWQIGEEEARRLERDGKVEIVDGIVKKAVYPEDERGKEKFTPFWSHLTSKDVGTAQNGKEELNSIFGKGMGFDTVKPTKLICELLVHFSAEVQILDFFAGSGTTGHAVMKLNAEDGGRRKFILVTNNENGICEKVTYERLKRVMEKEHYDAALKYMKIDYVPIDGRLYYEYADELLKHVRELAELENAVDISHDKTVEIVLTDKELDKLVARLTAAEDCRHPECRAVYVGHDVIMGNDAKEAFASRGIAVHRIPQYYYPELED